MIWQPEWLPEIRNREPYEGRRRPPRAILYQAIGEKAFYMLGGGKHLLFLIEKKQKADASPAAGSG
jgi:hypothetical protein